MIIFTLSLILTRMEGDCIKMNRTMELTMEKRFLKEKEVRIVKPTKYVNIVSDEEAMSLFEGITKKYDKTFRELANC